MQSNRSAPPALPVRTWVVALSALVFPAMPAFAAVSLYEGAWNNTTFGSTGPAHAIVDVVGTQVTFTLDLDGNVFGGSNPTPLVMTGTRNPDGSATFNPVVGHPTYGNVTGSLNSTGGILADGVSVPGPTVDSVHLAGQFMPSAIHLNYTVAFEPAPAAGTALGVIDMTLVPEPGAISLAGAASLVLALRGRRAKQRAD